MSPCSNMRVRTAGSVLHLFLPQFSDEVEDDSILDISLDGSGARAKYQRTYYIPYTVDSCNDLGRKPNISLEDWRKMHCHLCAHDF